MVYDPLDELEGSGSWQHWGPAERYYYERHYNPSAYAIKERAGDGIAAQQRDSVGADDEDGSDDKGYQVVNEQPEESGGRPTCECRIAQPTAGYVLQIYKKWGLIEEGKNNEILDQEVKRTDDQSAPEDGANERFTILAGGVSDGRHKSSASLLDSERSFLPAQAR
jgi:hypothetical protein